jgi:hypothetical protein
VQGIRGVAIAFGLALATPGLAASRRATPVHYQQLDLPLECDGGRVPGAPLPLGPARADKSRVLVATSARELRQLVTCTIAPPPDFRRVRVAVFRYTRYTAETYRLAAVSDDGSKIHLVFSVSHACQGIAQQLFPATAIVALPRDAKPVVADVEYAHQPPCGAVP